MVRNLLRGGYTVSAMFDTDASRMSQLKDRVPTASSARHVAQQADVVVTCQWVASSSYNLHMIFQKTHRIIITSNITFEKMKYNDW